MNRPFTAMTAATIAAMLATTAAFTDTIRVPDDYPTIQAGIDAAGDGDEVVVADGTYTGDGNRDMDFGGKAIIVRSENGADACIIDLQADETDPHRAFDFRTGETAGSVLEGLTIQNGFMDRGGAILCMGSSALFRSCVFRANTAWTDGLEEGGGAVYVLDAQPTFNSCRFLLNHAEVNIAGVGAGGGAAWVGSGCESDAGCAYSAFHGCLFIGNTANGLDVGDGGAVFVRRALAEFVNCTVSGNRADRGGALAVRAFGRAKVDNSILWNNEPEEIAVLGPGGAVAHYSDIQGGWTGDGNIDADPLFVDADSGDFRLSAGSPCIDAGDNEAVPAGVTVDLVGNPRFIDDPRTADTGNGVSPIVDIGAYEFLTCPADADGSGAVDFGDILAILGAWGNVGGPEDLDGSGTVDFGDLLIVLATWGPCA